MKATRKALSPAMSRDWATNAQLRFLDAIMLNGAWKPNELAFHGGTSLHMSWASSRFSEDLDFLIDATYGDGLPRLMTRIERRMQEQFLIDDAGFKVEIRNKTKDDTRLGNFHIVISHANIIGSTMVKAEFWMVDDAYLKGYPTTFRTPTVPGTVVARVSSPIPAADMATAYADKLTAMATRPFIKWRDLYDLWWLGTQTRAVPEPDSPETIAQFLHNLSAYKTPEGMTPQQALARFHEHSVDDLVKQAESDLKKWLPARHWEMLSSMGGVKDIIAYVDDALRKVESAVQAHEAKPSAPRQALTEPKPKRPKP